MIGQVACAFGQDGKFRLNAWKDQGTALAFADLEQVVQEDGVVSGLTEIGGGNGVKTGGQGIGIHGDNVIGGMLQTLDDGLPDSAADTSHEHSWSPRTI